jgi:hypothetical protein
MGNRTENDVDVWWKIVNHELKPVVIEFKFPCLELSLWQFCATTAALPE